MMMRGRRYTKTPMVTDTRSYKRRAVDRVLTDILFLIVGFVAAVVIATYYPLPWNF